MHRSFKKVSDVSRHAGHPHRCQQSGRSQLFYSAATFLWARHRTTRQRLRGLLLCHAESGPNGKNQRRRGPREAWGKFECFAKLREQLRFLSVQLLLGFVCLSGVSQERQQDFASLSQQQLALLAAFLGAGNALHVLPTLLPARNCLATKGETDAKSSSERAPRLGDLGTIPCSWRAFPTLLRGAVLLLPTDFGQSQVLF